MNKLKYWRSVRKLEVRELAKKAGVSPTTVSRLENDHIKGHSLTLAKLAEVLEVDLTEFEELIVDPKDPPVPTTKPHTGEYPIVTDASRGALVTFLV